MSIKDKALLVSLSVSIWTNAVHDSGVVSDIMSKTHTVEDVHRYKKVLIKPEMLAQVRAARTALRAHWWEHTLPWGNGGVRLLPANRYQTFMEKMRELTADYDRAVTAFCRSYPQMKQEARQRLRSLFHEEDFPSIEGIKRKFGRAIDYMPIPDAADFRVTLSEQERKALAKEIERQVADNTKGAMVALVDKLRETIVVLSERMKEADPAVRKSLVENIRDICKEVDSFNIVDDKKIEQFRKEAEKLAAAVDLEKVKDDKKARKEVADKADDILAKMAGYIGGSK